MDKDAGGNEVLRPAEVVVVNSFKMDPNIAESEQGWASAESGNTKLKGDLEDSSGTSPYGGNTAPMSSRIGAILNFGRLCSDLAATAIWWGCSTPLYIFDEAH